jgi:hypothetical protein
MQSNPRRSPRAFILLVSIVTLASTLVRPWLGAQGIPPAPGGFVESATSTDARPLLTTAEIQALLPERGQFTFPAPYLTTGVRLTNATDCGNWYDCVNTLGGATWRNMNNSAGSNFLYIVLGLDKSNGGGGPSLFRYNKTTGDTENVGPLYAPDDDRTWSTLEGWYFSATQPTTWYQNVDAQLQRYDILTHATSVVFDIRDQFGDDKEIWHPYSSQDDRVHSFILRLVNNYDQIGCGVYREDTHQFAYYPAHSLYLHECQVDKSGQWLLIKEDLDGLGGEDNRIIHLATGTETVLLEGQGAPGHSDNGFNGMVAADGTAALPGTVRTWTFPATPGPVVYHGLTGQPPSFVHLSFTNGRSAAFDQQFACGSAVSRTNGPRANEIVCVRLDGSLSTLVVAPVLTDLDAFGGSGGPGDDDIKQPVGNLDPTGEFYLWTSNVHSDRLDAFLVRVPKHLLVTEPTDLTPPTVAITLPADTATVFGDAALSATASDNIGVAGVQFKLDGVNLGAEITTAPYAWTWHTTTTSDGVHSLTAVARDAAGNLTTSVPVAITVLNTPDGPTISNVGVSQIIDHLALIAWTTSQLANSQIEYGLTTDYGSTTFLNPALTAAHLQSIGGLTVGTTYHYRVMSRSAPGTLATSADFTFSTASAPLISNMSVSALTKTSATISWTTDLFSAGQVEYGLTTDYHDATDLDDLTFTHAHTLTGLTPGTLYHCRIYAVTPIGVLSVSNDLSFITLPDLGGGPGGFLEWSGATDTRPLLTPAELLPMLPARGVFTFPAPYGTTGIRLTNAVDCGGGAADCVNAVGGAYWRNINNHAGSNVLYAFLGLDRTKGGPGPSVFRYNKTTGETTNLGPLFSSGDALSLSTGAGWYFSATQPTTLYVSTDQQLRRYDVLSHASATVFDVTSQFGADKAAWRFQSSNDDRVHSFTLGLATSATPLGCGVYREDVHQFSYFPSHGSFDECQVDKSGNWLLIKEDLNGLNREDNRIVDLTTGIETARPPQDGACGNSDTGFGALLVKCSVNSLISPIRAWAFGPPLTAGAVVYDDSLGTPFSVHHVSFANARSAPLDQQYACGSAANRVNGPRANEVVCFRLDGSRATVVVAPVMTDLDAPGGGPADITKRPKGNLDPTGEYFIWTSNVGGARLDAFIARVPSGLLMGAGVPADTSAPTVALTAPAQAATVFGDVAWSATSSDNVGVAGVQFRLDGVNLGAEIATAPYAGVWHTPATTDGVHVLTAVASDDAGNTTTSAPVTVTVLNTPGPPQITNVGVATLTATSAIVTWTTSQLADSQVAYGPTSTYGGTTTLDAARVATHVQTISGLPPGTTYHYRVQSTNAQGIGATSGDFVFTTLVVEAASALLPGLVDDGLNHPPPASGPYGYNSFGPSNTPGASYVEPVFGSTVHQLTTDHNRDDSYSRNMWWNADGTRYLHRSKDDSAFADYWDVIDAATGQITHRSIQIGHLAGDSGFDPIDPNVLYKFNGNTIRKITLGADGTWADTLYFTAPSTLMTLGATLNWLDAGGRLMLVRYGSEPSVHVYDRQDLEAGPFANPLDAATTIDIGSYLGLSPDGRYVVGYTSGGLGQGEGVSWKIDAANRTADPAPTRFWSLCGDHGTFVSASNGRNYMVVLNCYDRSEVWRVDITNNAAGLSPAQQRALPNNHRLLAFPTWTGGAHFSSVAAGPLRDWAFISTEDSSDVFDGGTDAGGVIAPWHAYRQEIIGFNVLTGETRRLAHHRSRSVEDDYFYNPRLTASWHGEYVGWTSNVNQPDSVDVFALSFMPAPPVISGIATSGVTGPSALVSWTTNQPADSRVEYGLTTAYGNTTPVDADLVLAHGLTLSGLTPGTTYHYRVRSANAMGLPATSGDFSFMTVPPVVVSAVAASAITGTSATITWTSDQLADSRVEWGLTSAYGSATTANATLVTAHAQALSGLATGTTYHYRVSSTNSVGMTTTSGDFTFTTVAPPVISGVTSSAVTGTSATIAWTTDQSTSTQVEYGLSSGYGSVTTLNASLTTSHSQGLGGLATGTTYHYRVKSTNSVGLLTTSGDFTFTTVAMPIVSSIAASAITGTSATITWTSDQLTDSQVEYGLTTAYGSTTTVGATLVTVHSQGLSGLSVGTGYHYRVRSTNSVGLTAISGDLTFTTVARPVLSSVAASALTGTTATITWTSDQLADSQVEYGLTTAYGSTTTVNPTLVTAHSQGLSGLGIGTTYHYRVKSTNGVGLLTTSGDFTFATVARPVLSSIAASALTGTTATIIWTSDQLADSQVEYGLTTAYGSTTTVNATLVTAHGQGLSGLGVGTTYHYRVKSTNGVGLLTTSGDFTFTTVAPPVVSGINASAITGTSATIGWTTDQLADSQVDYGLTTAYGSTTANAALVTAHGQPLGGLASGTTYHYRVRSTNVFGLLTTSGDFTFTTVAAPTISGVGTSGVTSSSATVAWTTDQLSDSQVDYGTTTAYGATTTLNGTLVTSHSQTLSGLASGATYHYRVKSRNAQGLLATSGDFTVTTLAPPVISALAASAITTTSATITWTTDQLADTQVDYGTTTAYGSTTTLNATLVTSHSQGLTGLTASTTYHVRVKSKNAQALLTTSGDFTFTTAAPPSAQAVVWTSLVNATVTGTVLKKTAGCTGCEDAGAVSTQRITAGDGYVEFPASEITTERAIGLSNTSAGTTGAEIKFALRFQDTAVEVRESGVYRSGTTFVATDVFRIAIVSGQIRYSKNGTVFYTSAVVPTYPLLVDTALLSVNGAFTNVVIFGAAPSATAPVISNVSASGVTGSGATIMWTTDQASDSQVEYGLTTGYGSATALNATLVTSHSQALSGLAIGTTYHYRVKSANAQSLLTTSGDFTFTTVAAPVISGVGASSVTGTSATIGWTTDQLADSQVDYGATTAYGSTTPLNAALVTTHGQPLSGLTAGTTYHYRVRSTNAQGLPSTSGDFVVTTTAPPVLSGIGTSAITSASATVSWTTDQPADSQAEYGLTAAYGSTTTLNFSLVTSHSQSLGGLAAGTVYHYRVISRNAQGLVTTSGDLTFTTAPPG